LRTRPQRRSVEVTQGDAARPHRVRSGDRPRGCRLGRRDVMAEDRDGVAPDRAARIIAMRGSPPTDADRPTTADRRAVAVRTFALTVLTILASTLALQWARPLLVPILIGILISYALDPMVRRLVAWNMPHAVAATSVFIVTLSGVALFGYALSRPLLSVADRLPSAAQELREAIESWRAGAPGPVTKVQQAAKELQKLSGAESPPAAARPKIPTVAIERKPFDIGEYLWEGSLSVTAFLAETVVVLFLALYLLLAGDTFRRRFVEIAGPRFSQKKNALQILDVIGLQISRYLFVRAVISGFVGVGTFAAFWTIGLAEPAVWGVAAGLLNVIPYIGPAAVTAAAGVAAFVQFHSVPVALLTMSAATAVACVEAYVLTPWLMSRTGEMNPAAVFIGLVFWGWLWGLPGLFLAVPIMMVLKAVSDHVDALQPLATIMKR
jgi:predicted PurR-regulated permease PerM